MSKNVLQVLTWVKPADRLPAHENEVLVCCGRDQGNPIYFLAIRRGGEWLESSEGWQIWDVNVVAWAEIPPPEGLG